MHMYPYGFYLGLRATVVDKSVTDLSPDMLLKQKCGAGGRARMRNVPVANVRVYVRVCTRVVYLSSWAYFAPRCSRLELRQRFGSFGSLVRGR